MPRIFFAVRTPELLMPEVIRMQQELVQSISSLTPRLPFRKEHLENSHCTLTFLGDVESSVLPRIVGSVHQLFERKPTNAITINLTHVGVFASRIKARVAWVGLGPVADLRLLKGRVDEGLRGAEIGFQDAEDFQPHLTLGRFKVPSRLPTSLQFPVPDGSLIATVSEIVMVESELTPAGAQHTILERFTLTEHPKDTRSTMGAQ